MWLKFLIVFIGVTLISGENCDHLGTLLYEDLGCTPHYDKSQDCPIKYSCVGIEPSKDKCYFRGKSYEDGERVDEKLSTETCDKGCFCSKYGGTPRFTCAILDCPEWLGLPARPGCYRRYSLDSCCSTEQACGISQNQSQCLVDGTDYNIGEMFYPRNTCLKCICHEGFRRKKYEEPFCQRKKCGVQLKRSSGRNVQNGCAPLYEKKTNDGVLCCPIGWFCPDETEDIKGDVKRDDTCKFGNKTLKVGQGFEKSNIDSNFGKKIKKVTCECVLPPLLTCHEE